MNIIGYIQEKQFYEGWIFGTKHFVYISFYFSLEFIVICNDLFIVTLQGVITEDVVQLRKDIGAPGMAVLQFGKVASDF